MEQYDRLFADRISDVPRSFIREILKDALDPSVISFAGGLPNRELFPVAQLRDAAARAFDSEAGNVLQYAESEGHSKLREFIARRYSESAGLDVPVDRILVTNGSQQGLDLLGKVLLNDGDPVAIEQPGYLGAIQALSLYRARYIPLPLTNQGMDIDLLTAAVRTRRPKLLYSVPNFQNPSGLSYSEQNRRDMASVLEGTDTLLVEDDPYGELRFAGSAKPSFLRFLPGNTVLLGSFSKVLAPGLRLGWIVAPPPLMDKLITAKQASDLHTSHLTQSIAWHLLQGFDLDGHISRIRVAYGGQCQAMLASMRRRFPASIAFTEPEGGMFVWADLPPGMAAMDLFEIALEDKVVFVPGDPFYVTGGRHRGLRLNFSCADVDTIETGIQRLGLAIQRLMDSRRTGSD